MKYNYVYNNIIILVFHSYINNFKLKIFSEENRYNNK